MKQGFDSPTGYFKDPDLPSGSFCIPPGNLVPVQVLPPEGLSGNSYGLLPERQNLSNSKCFRCFWVPGRDSSGTVLAVFLPSSSVGMWNLSPAICIPSGNPVTPQTLPISRPLWRSSAGGGGVQWIPLVLGQGATLANSLGVMAVVQNTLPCVGSRAKIIADGASILR